MIDVDVSGISAEDLSHFSSLPDILMDRAPDPKNLKGAFIAGFMEKLLQNIHLAYKIKSQGGTDELGHSWEPTKKPKSRIMRNTDTLMNSYKPNSVGNVEYIPGPDQFFIMNGTQVSFTSLVPYGGFAEAAGPGRQIIPDDITDWVPECVASGLRRVRDRLIQVRTHV